jgi:hypothetical protein
VALHTAQASPFSKNREEQLCQIKDDAVCNLNSKANSNIKSRRTSAPSAQAAVKKHIKYIARVTYPGIRQIGRIQTCRKQAILMHT